MKKIAIITLVLFILLMAYGLNSIFNSSSNNSVSTSVSKSNITLYFTGDVMLGRNVEGVLASGQNVFANVDEMFKNSDGAIINLEDPMTTSGTPYKSTIPLKANPAYAHVLKDNNIIVACLANNHVMDYGDTGLNDTISALKANGINYTGAGNNIDEASKPVYLNIKDRKIAILNYMDNTTFTGFSASEMAAATSSSAGYAPADPNLIKKDIDEAKNNSDMVIVVFHYGNEYSTQPNSYQVTLSHECIDDGADMVIGSHPHVIQTIETYNGKPIFYSLGNFVFDMSNSATHESLMVEMDLNNNTANIKVHPMVLVNYMPQLMNNASSNQLLANLKNESPVNMTINGGEGIISFPIE
ncbi:MAG: CapA family protein [Methanobacterium sp.]|nr:CapA family protein [Methanobacterium sp.]